MRRPAYTRQFERDLRRMERRSKNISKLKSVILAIVNEHPLPERLRDHYLVGAFQGRRECHIEPDWLLIYLVTDDTMIFERTGSHSDLFE
jgi:mRNA interferase YafQ